MDERYFRGLEGKYDFNLHFILQEKNAEAGDHIVRARGAWFGNRSISAEVDLEVGTYEVLPKIEASRDADAPDVQDVVIKVAERNPQKLRQIGLNYDIANAKGINELSEEEVAKREAKKKEVDEKKKKEKEIEEKEKIDFEAWKQEEKAEYEAWKKEKKTREEKEKPKEEVKDSEHKTSELESAEGKKEQISVGEDDTSKENPKATPDSPDASKPAVVVDLTIRAKDEDSSTNDPVAPISMHNVHESKVEVHEPSDDEANNTPDDDEVDPQQHGLPRPPASIASGVSGYRPIHGNRYPGGVYGDANPPPPPARRDSSSDQPKPWNAVCVLGLRVYSLDPEVSISLVKPKDMEEGAILDIDGDTPAGATM